MLTPTPPPVVTRAVKFCHVPADASEPMVELVFDEVPGDIGGFTTHINKLYAQQGGKVDVEVLRQQVSAHAAKNGNAAQEVPSDMLNQMALSQTVDIVMLMPAYPGNDWLGVNMYVDDKGIPKNLEINRRASAVTSACGIPTEVRGDAYISRLCDDQEDRFERHDLLLNELSADVAWVQGAKRYNEERLARPQQLPDGWMGSGGGGAPPAPPADPEECFSAASDQRAKGTAAFLAGDYATAAAHYREAATELGKVLAQPSHRAAADEQRLPIHLNLASALDHLEQPYDVIKACDVALEIDPLSVKGWYRRGQACMKIMQFAAARRNLHRAAELEPQNREIRQALELLAIKMKKHQEELAAANNDE
jgi:tetratricopeptide (TPR) repeat protein